MFPLEGKVAIVTGAGQGIGYSHALYLAKKGCDIVACDLNPEGKSQYGDVEVPIKEAVEKVGRKCIPIVTDITDSASIQNAVDITIETFGKIDILVCNAGGNVGTVQESIASVTPEDKLKATIERNLVGTIMCCQKVVPQMKKQGYGKIITTSSQAGINANEAGTYAVYGAAKAGIIQYTRSLATELGPNQINVNCIIPAFVETPRLKKQLFDVDNNREKYRKRIPLGRLAEPEEISKVVGFLAGDESSYVTGQAISVCGGFVNF